MKLRPSLIRLTLYFVISSIILLFVIVGMCFTIFFFEPFGYKQIIILASWLILSILWLVALNKNYFYTVEEKYLSVFKFKKESVYMYDEIIYLDYEYSKTHSSILFVTKLGHARYIVHDQKKQLLDILQSKCTKVKDRDSVVRQFPTLAKVIR